MPATMLQTHRVEKPWGRHMLYPGFEDIAPGSAPIGEVWFQEPGDTSPDLLIKYLFTSEKLSVTNRPMPVACRAARTSAGPSSPPSPIRLSRWGRRRR